jgi:hypothetical protein
MDAIHQDVEHMQQVLIEERDRAMEDREKALQTITRLNSLLMRVDVRLAELAQLKGHHPPAMCDVIEQMSKNKILDRAHIGNRGAEQAVPAVVLVAKR